MQDIELAKMIGRCSLGDKKALEKLYSQTSPHLFGLLLRITSRRDWAEEIMQETFITVWNKSSTFKHAKGAAMAWLTTIARNKAIDWLRRHPYREISQDELPEMEAIGASNPVEALGLQEEFTKLEDCLEELSHSQKEAILLSYYQGYTHSELTQRMESPLGTIKSWIRRGLAQLQSCLQ